MRTEAMQQLRAAFQYWRRRMKSKLPYVRRRHYNKVTRSLDELANALTSGVGLAQTAKLTIVKPIEGVANRELCLFVTHMATPIVKPHVREHIEQLLAIG